MAVRPGKGYNEHYFDNFRTQISDGSLFWNMRMYGTDSGVLYPLAADINYNSLVVSQVLMIGLLF